RRCRAGSRRNGGRGRRSARPRRSRRPRGRGAARSPRRCRGSRRSPLPPVRRASPRSAFHVAPTVGWALESSSAKSKRILLRWASDTVTASDLATFRSGLRTWLASHEGELAPHRVEHFDRRELIAQNQRLTALLWDAGWKRHGWPSSEGGC